MVKFLNFEELVVFEYVVCKGKEIDVDILIVMDSDVDCLGIVVKDLSGEYVLLIGN